MCECDVIPRAYWRWYEATSSTNEPFWVQCVNELNNFTTGTHLLLFCYKFQWQRASHDGDACCSVLLRTVQGVSYQQTSVEVWESLMTTSSLWRHMERWFITSSMVLMIYLQTYWLTLRLYSACEGRMIRQFRHKFNVLGRNLPFKKK